MNTKNKNSILTCIVLPILILIVGCDPRPLPLPNPPPPLRGSPPPCGDLVVISINPDPIYDKYYNILFFNQGQGTVSLPGSYLGSPCEFIACAPYFNVFVSADARLDRAPGLSGVYSGPDPFLKLGFIYQSPSQAASPIALPSLGTLTSNINLNFDAYDINLYPWVIIEFHTTLESDAPANWPRDWNTNDCNQDNNFAIYDRRVLGPAF